MDGLRKQLFKQIEDLAAPKPVSSAADELRKQARKWMEDLIAPSPVKAQMLDRIEHVVRSEKLARSLGFVFPEESQIPEVWK